MASAIREFEEDAVRHSAWALRAVPVGLLALLLLGCGATEDPRPNVVLLIGDDHGYPYFGFNGSTDVRTPTLDALAAEGAVFRQGFSTASVCQPALFSLLTGRYPLERRFYGEASEGEPQGLFGTPTSTFGTVPALLGEAGYATFQGGKHWEGHFRQAGFTAGTSDGGAYDQERVHQLSPIASISGRGGLTFARETMQPVYDFLDRHSEDPFLIWFAPMLPHAPMDPPEEFRNVYAKLRLSRSAEDYYANCTRFDAAVKELLDDLERRGVLDRTLVIYVSDNGLDQPPRAQYPPYGGPNGKLSVRELGLRTPIIVHYPGQVAAGATSDALVSIVDIAPTILDYAGVPIPEELPGRSLRAAAEGRASVRRSTLFGWQSRQRPPLQRNQIVDRPFFWATTERWHYVLLPDTGAEQLYDRARGLGAALDVATSHPDIAAQMKQQVIEWRDGRRQAVEQLVGAH